MDGNFHAEKMYMKKASNDLPLHNGEGFMVESTRYKAHIEAHKNDKQPVAIVFHCSFWYAHGRLTEINMFQPQGCELSHS